MPAPRPRLRALTGWHGGRPPLAQPRRRQLTTAAPSAAQSCPHTLAGWRPTGGRVCDEAEACLRGSQAVAPLRWLPPPLQHPLPLPVPRRLRLPCLRSSARPWRPQ
eukprot:366555-Chlamydomonas_euryale.AAC.10